ncbi:MAG: hypothetical protein HN521_18070 [Candidatus Latescibacteria bacterium]|nr:hypothetical protein [Candidatus Latescibacterota bacterium]
MNFNPFKKGGGNRKGNTLEKILARFAEMSPNSVNCSLVKSEDNQEDLERAFIFKHENDVLVKNQAIYISTPDGLRAEDNHMGKGDILHLWFLFRSVPHSIDCHVMGRIRFPESLMDDLAPRIPAAYMLRPVSNIRKIEKRQYLRYAHKATGDRRVYTQVLFDLFVTKTDVIFPETGSLPPYITDIHPIPHDNKTDFSEQSPEDIVKFMKNAIRLNTRESRVVYVSKPHMDERSNKVALLEMGKADVLGLELTNRRTNNQRSADTRNFYIRKPPKLSGDPKSSLGLKESDTMVLNFHTSVSNDAATEYYDLISEVTRVGTENLTVRTNGDIRKETGLPIDMVDFSIGGIKMECSDAFMAYILGSGHESMSLEEKVKVLESICYLLNFYPKLRFNRETEVYEPEIPMKIQILSKIVRIDSTRGILFENGEIKTENMQLQEGEFPQITGFGIKFYYDPAEYSRDTYSYDRFELIRDFKENKHFQEVHKQLNGLIAHLESQNR